MVTDVEYITLCGALRLRANFFYLPSIRRLPNTDSHIYIYINLSSLYSVLFSSFFFSSPFTRLVFFSSCFFYRSWFSVLDAGKNFFFFLPFILFLFSILMPTERMLRQKSYVQFNAKQNTLYVE